MTPFGNYSYNTEEIMPATELQIVKLDERLHLQRSFAI